MRFIFIDKRAVRQNPFFYNTIILLQTAVLKQNAKKKELRLIYL